MNLKAQLQAAVNRGQDIIAGAKAAARELTDDEIASLTEINNEVKGLREAIEKAEQTDALIKSFAGDAPVVDPAGDPQTKTAATLGEHFKMTVGNRIAELKQAGTTLVTPEFKAASDYHSTTGIDSSLVTTVDRTIVKPYRRPVVSDVFGSGTLSGQAITYFVEGAREGNFTTVGEGTTKPQLHYVNPTPVTDRLKEIAGWIGLTDDMVDDLDFLVSEINGRLLYDLSLVEESQLLNGDGTGNNLLGVLNRSGLQTETSAAVDDNADSLFRAITKIQNVTGLQPDGLLINPADYQALRLAKDGNGQYFGGGFFQGQYGNDGIDWQPPVWGLRTVVTPAVAAGAPLVGAFKQATTVYRKGGVKVESTNSHGEDFINDRIVIRAKERLALAVRVPSAIVKVTLADDSGSGGDSE